MAESIKQLAQTVRDAARPLQGTTDDYAPLLDAIGESRLVLLGEASHGTHEFYATRARISRQLIEHKGFTAVVAEADWPDAWRVNRYVRGFADDADADSALSGFRRFPQWMWRNTDVLKFVEWLRGHNDALPREQSQVGFYGMDLYSLYGSIAEVLAYLNKVDPVAARRARFRYGCFGHFAEDAQAYGYAAGFDLGRSCEDAVVQQLIELRQRRMDYARRDGRVAEDEYFYAEQNARLIKNAERYYRTMFEGRTDSWNLRDSHMVDTLEALMHYFDRHVGRAKFIVWAHNSHLGDARATDSSAQGQFNVGQLVRERWGEDQAFLLGFTTHTGGVTAASNWDGPAERKRVRPSLPDSYERVFHEASLEKFLLLINQQSPARRLLQEPRLERAIGVIYRPETERLSHYFEARLPEQFDAVIHFDVTSAVQPLEEFPALQSAEVPETYPTGV